MRSLGRDSFYLTTPTPSNLVESPFTRELLSYCRTIATLFHHRRASPVFLNVARALKRSRLPLLVPFYRSYLTTEPFCAAPSPLRFDIAPPPKLAVDLDQSRSWGRNPFHRRISHIRFGLKVAYPFACRQSRLSHRFHAVWI